MSLHRCKLGAHNAAHELSRQDLETRTVRALQIEWSLRCREVGAGGAVAGAHELCPRFVAHPPLVRDLGAENVRNVGHRPSAHYTSLPGRLLQASPGADRPHPPHRPASRGCRGAAGPRASLGPESRSWCRVPGANRRTSPEGLLVTDVQDRDEPIRDECRFFSPAEEALGDSPARSSSEPAAIG